MIAANTDTDAAEPPFDPIVSVDLSPSTSEAAKDPDNDSFDEEPDVICGSFRDLQVNMARARSVIFAKTSPIPFQYFTLRNIKLFAFILILIFICYHGIHRTNDSCRWLMREGRIQGGYLWQPNGCMMHPYTSQDARRCMHHITQSHSPNRIVFIGDSRLRYLYNATVLHVTGKSPVFPVGKHNNHTTKDDNLKLSLEFYWVTMVDSRMRWFVEVLLAEPDKSLPTLILLSSGTWTMKLTNSSEPAYKEYKQNLTALVPLLNRLGQRTRVVWVQQDPVFSYLLTPDRELITNDHIWKYNVAAEDLLWDSSVMVWWSAHSVFWATGDTPDGLHQGNESLRMNTQILLNYYCNREISHRDATCCAPRQNLNSMQIAALSIFGIFFALSVILTAHKYSGFVARLIRTRFMRYRLIPTYTNGVAHHDKAVTIKDAKLPKKTKTPYVIFSEVCFAIAKMGLIMGYFILCDRTDFFMKENKYYSNINFFVPLTYIFLVGIFFSENSEQSTLLHRDQTDEWKGWMQFVILVYHMTAGSTKLTIYMHIRVLVSSYLFLNGYAHFMYFWNKGDVSAYRFFQIAFRMNLLVFCLCIVMDRPYQFYYFVPLVTFWFLVTYSMMALPPHLTDASSTHNPKHYFYMVLKFIAVFGVISSLYLSQTFFDRIFLTKPWSALFLFDSSGNEWFFRWKLDRYSVLEGMVFGFLVVLARKFGWMNETLSENLFPLRKSVMMVAAGTLGLVGYFIFAMMCSKKVECNDVHSYVVVFPILGFIMLRNTFGIVRRRFSTLFAWAGQISLELFIVQFHVWLAADTYGVLVFVPGYPMLNVIFTSFIYICVAHEVHVITGVLAEHLVPKDWKYLILALVVFCLLLTLLAFCYGL